MIIHSNTETYVVTDEIPNSGQIFIERVDAISFEQAAEIYLARLSREGNINLCDGDTYPLLVSKDGVDKRVNVTTLVTYKGAIVEEAETPSNSESNSQDDNSIDFPSLLWFFTFDFSDYDRGDMELSAST